MKKSLFALAGCAALLFSVGCVRTPGGLSCSNTPLGNRSYTVIGDAYGEDTSVYLLGILPVSSPDHIQNAIDEAKTSVKADALIDVTVEGVSKYFILFSTYTIEVRAKGIKFNTAKAQ